LLPDSVFGPKRLMLREERPRLVLFTQSLLDSISPGPETSASALEPSGMQNRFPTGGADRQTTPLYPHFSPGICFWALNRCPFATVHFIIEEHYLS